MEQIQIQKLHERVQALEERDGNRHAETTPEATPPSQRRSSVASTELLQEPVFTAPASYPVDAITESQHCHLMTQWQNFKVKAAVGSVLPPEPGATYHCRPIPEGYARVMVDEITEGFEDLQLDHPTGEGETRLGSIDSMPMAEGAHQASELDASASSSSSGESGHSASSTASSSVE